MVCTLVGAAVVVVGAFLHWTRGIAGDGLSNRSLFQVDFAGQADIVKSAGGIAVVIGMLAVLGLVDRTGWLARLAGALSVVLFALFAIEVFRSAQHSVQAGAWALVVGGVLLLAGGMFGPRPAVVVEHPAVIEQAGPSDRAVAKAPGVTGGPEASEAAAEHRARLQ